MALKARWPHFILPKTQLWTATKRLGDGWEFMDIGDSGLALLHGDLVDAAGLAKESAHHGIIQLPDPLDEFAVGKLACFGVVAGDTVATLNDKMDLIVRGWRG
jgi:hypothetical protein